LSISEAVKKIEKLAFIVKSEDKSNKQQNQATHSFSLTTKIDLIFRSQQIWGDKKTRFSPVMTSCALSVVLSIQKVC